MAVTNHDKWNELALREAVSSANIPTLLMVIVQLTGEMHWLEAPYRPTRIQGVNENDLGGLPEAIQAKIRDRAAHALIAWHNGFSGCDRRAFGRSAHDHDGN